MNPLATAPFKFAFPHGLSQLRLLDQPTRCPKCCFEVLLAVVGAEPETAKCLACTGPSEPETRP